MRLDAVDSALRRFERGLAPHLGRPIERTRVRFDTHGWSVRCDLDPGSTIQFGPRGDAGHARVVAGPVDRGLAQRLGEGEVGDAIAADLDALVREVAPRRTPSEVLDARACARLGAAGGESVREWAELAPWIAAYERHHGVPLRAVHLAGDVAPSIAFPGDAGAQGVFMHAPPALREDARMLAYLEDLGFAIDEAGLVSTVPLPSYARRRARLGIEGGLRPELVPAIAVLLSPSRWLRDVARGVLPINVYGARAYALSAPARAIASHVVSMRAGWATHFHALAHDMGLHVLAMHRVPSRALAPLSAIAREALGRDRRAAARAARFFEERLTRACCDLWIDCADPDAYATRFEAALPGLERELRAEALGR